MIRSRQWPERELRDDDIGNDEDEDEDKDDADDIETIVGVGVDVMAKDEANELADDVIIDATDETTAVIFVGATLTVQLSLISSDDDDIFNRTDFES